MGTRQQSKCLHPIAERADQKPLPYPLIASMRRKQVMHKIKQSIESGEGVFFWLSVIIGGMGFYAVLWLMLAIAVMVE